MKKRLFSFGLVFLMVASCFGCSKEKSTEEVAENEEVEIVPTTIEKSEYGNPITGFDASGKMIYGGDPAALVDGDTVYLYTGHDTASNESYKIPEWQCYSTKDMKNWKYEGVVLKAKDISWADDNSAWAGQVFKYNDKYYFYTCSWANTDEGKQSIGVAVSDSPLGPFTDIGQPLVKGSFTTDETSTWNDIDPTVWVETDANGVEHRYLAWGNGKLYMCELNEDMTSVKDIDSDGKIIFGKDVISQKTPNSYTEAPWLYRRKDENGKYYGDYYLFYAYGWREQLAYATCDDLMSGNWKFGGVIMEPTATSDTNHPSVIDFNGKTYFIYHNGSLPKGSGYRRVVCVEELVFDDDGKVSYITETATGINGETWTITSLNGDKLTHIKYENSSSDGSYPYLGVKLGSDFKNATEADSLWQITPGKADKNNENYVSIESYNKPGMYVTAAGKDCNLSQDSTGSASKSQTFITIEGLAGEGISFESVKFKGKYLAIVDGKATLVDGTGDKNDCTFVIE